ncbi:hypothetical protein [Kitasatospora sp. NPDC004289]
MNVAPYLPLLLLAVGLLGFAVVASRGRRRREREALASQWEWLLRQQETHRSTGVRMLQVVSVYQRARRGSKAHVRWCESGKIQDAWFKGWHVPPGAFVLVTGGVGWGPHNRIEGVLYVEPGQTYGWAPATAPAAWQRQQAHLARSSR